MSWLQYLTILLALASALLWPSILTTYFVVRINAQKDIKMSKVFYYVLMLVFSIMILLSAVMSITGITVQ